MSLRDLTSKLPLGSVSERISLGALGHIGDVPFNVRTLVEAGVIRPLRPDKLARIARELRRWGPSPAAGIAAAAIQRPDAIAIADDSGEFSFGELHRRTNALARGLREAGIAEGDGVAIMARNHHGFVEATLACAKLGANALYMNTAFSAPQFADVVEREQPTALIYDEEFAGLLSEARDKDVQGFIAWPADAGADEDEGPDEDESPDEDEAEDGESGADEGEDSGEVERTGDPTLEQLIEQNDDSDLESTPEESSRFVILTSGTTGTPKGAQRGQPDNLSPIAVLFSRIPMRAEEPTMIAAPLFHSWGFSHFLIGLSLGSTYVLRRRFDPEETLRATAQSGATALIVVPVMLQRILDLDEETLGEYELSDLRVTAASGSVLPGPLATKWMDAFGDNLYNLYGSTEVAWATIGTPDDLRQAPGTAGRAPRGTRLRIVDPDGNDVETGKTGRIFVANDMLFEGYTGGGGKEELDGLLSTGDVGHLDEDGRLFVDGRDDDMIVSGGENVFPREVEDLLANHDAVAEVAVIGVDDDEYGQRLKAFIVTRDGSDLDADEVKSKVKSNLAGYKVPRDVEFLDSLPRNSTGKVLKRELA